ncbi:MAG: hypothetical protein Q9218_001431, partial [Villophora microphyllina]
VELVVVDEVGEVVVPDVAEDVVDVEDEDVVVVGALVEDVDDELIVVEVTVEELTAPEQSAAVQATPALFGAIYVCEFLHLHYTSCSAVAVSRTAALRELQPSLEFRSASAIVTGGSVYIVSTGIGIAQGTTIAFTADSARCLDLDERGT